jgi:hypothetical protein
MPRFAGHDTLMIQLIVDGRLGEGTKGRGAGEHRDAATMRQVVLTGRIKSRQSRSTTTERVFSFAGVGNYAMGVAP